MYEHSSKTLVEAPLAALPARARMGRGASRWISPVAFAPLLIGALALIAPGGAFAAADNYVKSMDLELTSGEVVITSSDGETYDTIQDGDVGFSAKIRIDLRHPGAFDAVAIHLGKCTGHHGECYTRPLIFSTTASGRNFSQDPTFTVPSGETATIDMRQTMLAICNGKRDETVGASGDTRAQLDIGATLAVDTRISHLKPIPAEAGSGLASHGLGLGEYSKTKTFPFKLKLACAPLPTRIKAPPEPFSVDVLVKQIGETCPKQTEVTARIKYHEKTTSRFRFKVDGEPSKWFNVKAKKVPPNSPPPKPVYLVEHSKTYHLDPGQHHFRVEAEGGKQSDVKTLKIDCPPFKVTSLWLTYKVEDKDTCPKKVVEKVTGKATRPGTAPFEIKTQGGLVVHSGTASFDRKGKAYVAKFGRNNLGFSNAFESDMMALIKTQPDANSGWVKLKIECKYKPTDAGASTDLAPELPPGDPPVLGPTLTGDFSFIDNGGTRCPRQGKALINFKTSKPDNVHWSLDCTNGHFSGVAQTAPSPKGGYIAPALASFAVNQTTHAKCVLKTVAPGKAKVHTLKGHLFQCVGRTDVGGPQDLTPETPSDPQKPGTAVVDPVKPEKPSTAVADPVKPVISCANGVVRNGACTCEPHFKPVKAGKNAWRCVRSVADPKPETPIVSEPKISCAMGTVKNGACSCARTHKLVKKGKNAWACVKVVVDPPRNKTDAKAEVKTAPKKTAAPKSGNAAKAKGGNGKAKSATKGNGSSVVR